MTVRRGTSGSEGLITSFRGVISWYQNHVGTADLQRQGDLFGNQVNQKYQKIERVYQLGRAIKSASIMSSASDNLSYPGEHNLSEIQTLRREATREVGSTLVLHRTKTPRVAQREGPLLGE